jgi:hypothetical protein
MEIGMKAYKKEKTDNADYQNESDIQELSIDVELRKSVYERFYYTKNLIHNKYHEFILNLDNKDVLIKFGELLKAQNYSDNDFGKLLKRIEKWNNLEAPIPLFYTEFIGLKQASIETAAKADMKAFKDAMQQECYPEGFFLNTSSGVLRVSLPANTPEKEALEIARNYELPERIKARYICIKDLKTIVLEPDNSFYTLTYPPILSIRKNLIIPGHMSNCNEIRYQCD